MDNAAISVADINRRIAELQDRLVRLDAEKYQLELEVGVLQRLVKGAAGAAPSVRSDKIGPSDAVRRVLRENPAGVSWRSLIETAMPLVSTDPSKAKKTLDQTIRNLLNKDIREENDLLYPMNKNGH